MTALFLYTSSSICYWSLSEQDKLNAHLAQFQYSPSSVFRYLISRDKIPTNIKKNATTTKVKHRKNARRYPAAISLRWYDSSRSKVSLTKVDDVCQKCQQMNTFLQDPYSAPQLNHQISLGTIRRSSCSSSYLSLTPSCVRHSAKLSLSIPLKPTTIQT